jgi:hypothetical protein
VIEATFEVAAVRSIEATFEVAAVRSSMEQHLQNFQQEQALESLQPLQKSTKRQFRRSLIKYPKAIYIGSYSNKGSSYALGSVFWIA